MARPLKPDNERVGVPRLSITITPQQRKDFRIAAALRGEEVGQWAVQILEAASTKALERVKGATG